MAMSDEARDTPKHTHTKPKKSFAERFLPQKGDSSSEIISKIVVLISILALIVCAVILADYFYQIYEAKKNNQDIRSLVESAKQQSLLQIIPDSPDEDTTAAVGDTDDTVSDEPVYSYELLPAAKELLAINPDCVGLVEIPDCVYEPVVIGEDNTYYLTHNIYDNVRQCGTCFADYRNIVYGKDRSDNIVLYAHNQKDGTMFGNLDYYRWDPAYWLKNPFIYFNTNYSEETYVIISSFVTNDNPEHDNGNRFDYYNFINFDDGQYSYETWIKEITERSTIITGVDVGPDDDFITLSTCSTEWDDSRHVIVGRKLRNGETIDSIDTTLFQKNPNPKWPAIYYKYNGGTYIEQE